MGSIRTLASDAKKIPGRVRFKCPICGGRDLVRAEEYVIYREHFVGVKNGKLNYSHHSVGGNYGPEVYFECFHCDIVHRSGVAILSQWLLWNNGSSTIVPTTMTLNQTSPTSYIPGLTMTTTTMSLHAGLRMMRTRYETTSQRTKYLPWRKQAFSRRAKAGFEEFDPLPRSQIGQVPTLRD
jgi:hypothetical protein